MEGGRDVRVQIVCKRTTVQQLQDQILLLIGTLDDLDFIQRRGHVLVEMCPGVYRPEILDACRESHYAYLRVTEIEAGGYGQGRAACVSDLDGSPMKPGNTWKQPDGVHAVFCDRIGLIVSVAARSDHHRALMMNKLEVKGKSIRSRQLVNIEWTDDQSFEDIVTIQPDWQQKLVPLMRATVRKMNCLNCTHVHFQAIEVEETNGEVQVAQG